MTSAQWTYRIPQQGKPSVLCNLTRGVLNNQQTGAFVARLEDVTPKNLHIRVGCPHHDDWWDDLEAIEESGWADCEYCSNLCYPVLSDGQYDAQAEPKVQS